jgi:homoserine kinase
VRLTARVPATSANLGPGFDALAIALDLCNDVTIETASSAAVVAGVSLAFAALDRELDSDTMAPFTDRFESHHDNVAAALRGALTIAFGLGEGWSAARLEAHPDLRPVVLVPEARLSTALAREALPSAVRLEDAAFGAGRAALVVHALTVAPSLLPVALEDRLHQEVRLELLPGVREVFEKLRSDGVPVCVSGAGPSLLAFETPERSVPDPGGSWRALRASVRSAGVEVSRG